MILVTCPMVDCDPDEVRDDEKEEGEVGGEQGDSVTLIEIIRISFSFWWGQIKTV